MLTGWLQISARNTPGQSPTPSVLNVIIPEPAPSTPVLQEEDVSVSQPSDDVVMEDAVEIEPRTSYPFRSSVSNQFYHQLASQWRI